MHPSSNPMCSRSTTSQLSLTFHQHSDARHAIMPCSLAAASTSVVASLATSCSCEKAPWVVHAYAKQLGRIFRLRMAHLHIVIVTDAAEALRLTSR